MTSPQRTITAELRKWHKLDDQHVEGFVYDDINEVWEDGERALLFPIIQWVESPNFWLAITNTACYKLSKDEQQLNGTSSVAGT